MEQLALTPARPTDDPMQMMVRAYNVAIERGEGLEVVNSIMANMKEQRDFQARVDFDNALNECQRKIERVVPKRKRENDIMWADYLQIDAAARPVYLDAGLSIGFSEMECADKTRVRMMATVSRGSVSREYFAETSRIPPNSKMSQADADASAASRAKRYLMVDIFNIAVGIDRDERKVHEAGAMGDQAFLPHQEAMESARTLDELKAAYLAAVKAAGDIGDVDAGIRFEKMKNELLAKLKGQK